MKKIVFVDITMKEDPKAVCYKGKGNTSCNYDGEVVYPINAILAESLKKDNEVKVVLLQTKGDKENIQECIKKNTDLFKKELNDINHKIGAKISYVEISEEYKEAKKNHEKRIMAILEQMEKDAELYGDITFGPRTMPMVMLCAFSFAEKYYDTQIKKIIYGKVEWVKRQPQNQDLYDITSLYYLNNLTYNLQVDSAEKALNSLKAFFSL